MGKKDVYCGQQGLVSLRMSANLASQFSTGSLEAEQKLGYDKQQS